MTRGKSIWLWIISIIIMIFVVVYQKTTGPTYPVKGEINIEGIEVDYSLPTSNDGEYTKLVYLIDESKSLTGTYKIRRFKSNDEWSNNEMLRSGDTLYFEIPHQPAAGKVMYHVFLKNGDKPAEALTKNPIILRFRDAVPFSIVVLHIIFIFATITLSTRTGFEALYNGNKVKIFTILTLIALIIGGFVFGPLMQKFAFGEYWTGWPMKGIFNIGDLTDSKTFIALIFWLIALWTAIKKPEKKLWPVIASIVLIIIFLIPHSLLGSELDYTKIENDKIEQIHK